MTFFLFIYKLLDFKLGYAFGILS